MKFEVGEIALYYGAQVQYHGEEVVILGELQYEDGMISEASGKTTRGMRHLVQASWKSSMSYCSPKVLRKKKPPNRDIEQTRQSPVSWDECIWKPEREYVNQ